MAANLKQSMAYLEKKEAKIETGQEPRKTEIKSGLEEMNVIESEIFQEKPEAVAKHQEVSNEEVALETIGVRRIYLGNSNQP